MPERRPSAEPPLAAVNPIIRLHEADNVVVARATLLPGTAVEEVAVARRIPPGHKVAVAPDRGRRGGPPLRPDHRLRDRGRSRPGEHVHIAQPRRWATSRATTPSAPTPSPTPAARAGHLQGHRRADGRVATRNYIGILTSVNCSAHRRARHRRRTSRARPSPARPLADYPERRRRRRAHAQHRLRHGQPRARGCSSCAARSPATRAHANFAAVLVVGLGCEANQISAWLAQQGLREGETSAP